MTLIEMIHQMVEMAHDNPELLGAHVEVNGHDGSWAWVDEVRFLELRDVECGVTRAVVLGVSQEGVRVPEQPIGKPASSYSGPHTSPQERTVTT
jgi:hypothetical protein